MPPRFRLCPLCQQGFGSASLDIHIPQCYQKALKRWQVNPVGPMPIMPGSKPPLSRGGKHGNSGVPCNRSAFVKQSSHDGKSSQNIPEYIEENANLHPCSRCGRKFLFDRIAYHESVCKANMKLKVFDSRKQRAIEGQSDDVFRGTDTRRRKKDASSGSKATVPSPGIPRTRWREQHREFIEAMRAARGAHKASAAMWGDASVKEVQLKPSRLKCTPPAVTRHMKGIQISRQRAVHSTEAGSVKEQRPARELPRQARNSAFGGGGERFNYRTSNGGGQMRIINDNTTSLDFFKDHPTALYKREKIHMLRRSPVCLIGASRLLFSGGNSGPTPYQDKPYPIQPHGLNELQQPPETWRKSPFMSKLMDQSLPVYDDVVTGAGRLYWQEPAKVWHMFEADDTLILEEHDREEWNERPYIAVNHLYEPPIGSEERPIRVESVGNPGDQQVVMCFGNCAPHVPQSTYYMMMKGYTKNKCPMCQQWFYIHNRPWLVMHPDWTDEPAADEGPAYTFAEIEAEFDRDFHEFAVYLNAE